MSFRVYIPARYASSRLPGKPLADLGGEPLIVRVCERARASGAQTVVVATDDARVADAVNGLAEVCMTSPDLASGSDRVAAAAAARGEVDDAVIVNLQGDEPEMPAVVIRQVADRVAAGACDMASVCEPLAAEHLDDPNVVKVVRGAGDRALYFSRAPIPWDRDAFAAGEPARHADLYRRHVGIYGYSAGYLRRFVALPPAALETTEALEQLRALVAGANIAVPDALAPCGVGIDTPADLERARRRFSGGS